MWIHVCVCARARRAATAMLQVVITFGLEQGCWPVGNRWGGGGGGVGRRMHGHQAASARGYVKG